MTRQALLSAALAAALLLPCAALAGTVTGTVSYEKGNADMVVSVEVPGATLTPPSKNPVLNQKDMKFQPHILPVVQGTTVDFYNSDPVNHNVFSPDHEAYNLGTWVQGQTRNYTFAHAGVYTQLCSLHPEMEGYVVVLDTPYYAVTDADGKFSIQGVPDGHYEVHVWGSKLRKAERTETFAVDVKDGKGTLAITWDD
jgi:plastocyanin